jgi:hypothetical protein
VARLAVLLLLASRAGAGRVKSHHAMARPCCQPAWTVWRLVNIPLALALLLLLLLLVLVPPLVLLLVLPMWVWWQWGWPCARCCCCWRRWW